MNASDGVDLYVPVTKEDYALLEEMWAEEMTLASGVEEVQIEAVGTVSGVSSRHESRSPDQLVANSSPSLPFQAESPRGTPEQTYHFDNEQAVVADAFKNVRAGQIPDWKNPGIKKRAPEPELDFSPSAVSFKHTEAPTSIWQQPVYGESHFGSHVGTGKDVEISEQLETASHDAPTSKGSPVLPTTERTRKHRSKEKKTKQPPQRYSDIVMGLKILIYASLSVLSAGVLFAVAKEYWCTLSSTSGVPIASGLGHIDPRELDSHLVSRPFVDKSEQAKLWEPDINEVRERLLKLEDRVAGDPSPPELLEVAVPKNWAQHLLGARIIPELTSEPLDTFRQLPWLSWLGARVLQILGRHQLHKFTSRTVLEPSSDACYPVSLDHGATLGIALPYPVSVAEVMVTAPRAGKFWVFGEQVDPEVRGQIAALESPVFIGALPNGIPSTFLPVAHGVVNSSTGVAKIPELLLPSGISWANMIVYFEDVPAEFTCIQSIKVIGPRAFIIPGPTCHKDLVP